jgi:hypothetical protein
MKKTLLFTATAFLIASCNNEPVNENPNTDQVLDTLEKKIVEEVQYPEDAKFNDFAQFIGGYEGRTDSYLKDLEAKQSWKSFSSSLDGLWKKTNDKLPAIKEWSNKELSDINENGGTLFYPFSGADFLHADLFFPEYENITMLALEPYGTIPDLKNAHDTVVSQYLDNTKASMNAILRLSFFRTVAMADDFKSKLDGTLHVLMHFMARTGHEVMWQEEVAINMDGSLTTDVSSVPDSSYFGCRYYFKRKGEDKVRTLTYFPVNLMNTKFWSRVGLVEQGLEVRTDLVNYIKGLNIDATYIKSASYLMHRSSFSLIRDLILNESDHILQDDSGIPVQYFHKDKWELTFYGQYTHTISLFSQQHQEDLKEIYADQENYTIKHLPFGIGYMFRKGTSNIMRASKIK